VNSPANFIGVRRARGTKRPRRASINQSNRPARGRRKRLEGKRDLGERRFVLGMAYQGTQLGTAHLQSHVGRSVAGKKKRCPREKTERDRDTTRAGNWRRRKKLRGMPGRGGGRKRRVPVGRPVFLLRRGTRGVKRRLEVEKGISFSDASEKPRGGVFGTEMGLALESNPKIPRKKDQSTETITLSSFSYLLKKAS